MRKASEVFIEISGRCNANCPYCAQHRLKQIRPSGEIMPPVLFEKILRHLFEIGIIENNYTATFYLYNWGEPFLNPEINKILRILSSKNIYVGISSNFIAKPNIDQECLSTLSAIVFSLSGISQSAYGRIHGASVDNTLNNFNDFYMRLRRYAPKTKIIISWHRYLFNENEFWKAFKYFDRPGISFKPIVAFLNDGLEIKNYLNGQLAEDRKRQMEKDIFLGHFHKILTYHKKKSNNYRCPAGDHLVIDETGQLLLCCGVTRYDSRVLGNALEMDAKDIWNSKLTNHSCGECISSGLARWAYNQEIGGFHDKTWPSGNHLNRLKLWFQCNNPSLASVNFLARVFKKLPYGAKIIHLLKNK